MKIKTLTGFLVAATLAACTSPPEEAKHPETPTYTPLPSTATGAPTSSPTTTSTNSPEGTMAQPAIPASAPGSMASPPGAVGVGSPMNLVEGRPMAVRFTDAESAAILNAIHTGEIDEAKLALKTTKDKEVKDFAKMMVDHHTEVRDRQGEIFEKLSVAPTETPKSRDLKAEQKKNLDALKKLKAADFDRAYIDMQVKQHEAALPLIDEQILPSAQSGEYKALLRLVRERVDQHRKAAQELQKRLSQAPKPEARLDAPKAK